MTGKTPRAVQNECYRCVHKKDIPGDTNISCTRPDPDMRGNPHGYQNGWFFYPINFDPVWKMKLCSNYSPSKPDPKSDPLHRFHADRPERDIRHFLHEDMKAMARFCAAEKFDLITALRAIEQVQKNLRGYLEENNAI